MKIRNLINFVQEQLKIIKHLSFVPINLRIEGASGSGKSVVLLKLREFLNSENIPHVITTTCGCLASHYEYFTFHSVLGIDRTRINKSWFTLKKENFISNSPLTKQLKQCKVFIIDEYTQLDASAISYLDFVLRGLNNSDSPFSNCLIILCGDLYQIRAIGTSLLSRVNFSNEETSFASLGIELFKSFHTFYLTSSERHSRDPYFLKLLHNIRNKTVTEEDIKLLNSRRYDKLKESEKTSFCTALLICQKNKTITKYNRRKLHNYSTNKLFLRAKVFPKGLDYHQYEIDIAIGCKVVCTVNQSVKNGLVNGSTGRVLGCIFPHNSLTPECLMVKIYRSFCQEVELSRYIK